MNIMGFEGVVRILSFELKKKRDAHSLCTFSAIIRENEEAKYYALTGKMLCVQQDNGVPIFFGNIQEIGIEKTYHSCTLHIAAVSQSILIDQEQKTRIFQNPAKTYGDILSSARLSLKRCDLRLSEEVKKQPYALIALQNQETNFSFIRRMANLAENHVWVIDTIAEHPMVKVSSCLHPAENILSEEDILSYRLTYTTVGKRVSIRLKKYIELGRVVKLGQHREMYLIIALEVHHLKGQDEFTYELEEFSLTRAGQSAPDKLAGNAAFPPLERPLRFKAKVINVADPQKTGQIQVHFIDRFLEDMDKELPCWIQFRSPYSGKGGGIVFLPDIGDIVEVVFMNGQCFSCTALRDAQLLQECSNVKEKYIGNNTKQRIFWHENSIEIRSVENQLLLDGEKLELCVGKNKIIMDKNQVVLSVGSQRIQMDDKQILLQGKGGQLLLSDKVYLEGHGDIRIKGSGTISVNGSSVNLC